MTNENLYPSVAARQQDCALQIIRLRSKQEVRPGGFLTTIAFYFDPLAETGVTHEGVGGAKDIDLDAHATQLARHGERIGLPAENHHRRAGLNTFSDVSFHKSSLLPSTID